MRKMYLEVETREDYVLAEGCGETRFYPYPEIEGIYVSRDGLVASTRLFKDRVSLLKQNKAKNGYINVVITVDGKSVNKLAHRLVLETFVPKPDDEHKWEAGHIDSVRDNNELSNLKWVTKRQNIQQRTEEGSLNKITYVFDRVIDTVTEYPSRQEAAKALNIQTSNLTTAIKYESIIKGRYYVTDYELHPTEYYYLFKEYDLKKHRSNKRNTIKMNKLQRVEA